VDCRCRQAGFYCKNAFFNASIVLCFSAQM
jgi:hypothetical protein